MKRPLAVIGFALFCTLLILNYIPMDMQMYIIAISIIVMVFVLFVPFLRNNKILVCMLFTSVISCGISVANYGINIKPVEKYDQKNCKVYGRIVDEPHFKNNQYSYIMNVESVDDFEVKEFKTQITSSTPLECELYDYFECYVNFYIPNSTNYFDSRTYFKSKGIYVVSYFDSSKNTRTTLRKDVDLWYIIIEVRKKILHNFRIIFPEEVSSIASAILLGEKNKLSNDDKILFTKNGIYHLFVTSGTHMAIICSVIFWIFKKLKINRKIFAAVGIMAILLFISVTCFNLSTLRSGIMFIIYLIGLILQKKPDRLNSLGVSVFLICIFSPMSALSMGFLFSILSILGIILFHDDIKNVILSVFNNNIAHNSIINYVVDSVSLSVSASVITIPITAIYFKTISIIFIISNLIFLPIIMIIIILSMLVSIGGFIGTSTFFVRLLSNILKFTISMLLYLSKKFALLPFCYINVNYEFLKIWVVFSLIIIFISVLAIKNRKSKLFSNLICVTTLAFCIIFNNLLNRETIKLSITKCGNGVGLILSNGNHNTAILCSNSNLQIDRFESLLNLSNISNLDYFALVCCRSYPTRFLKNLYDCLNLNTLLMDKNYDIRLSNKMMKSLVTFDDEAKLQFPDKSISANIKKINDKIYTLLEISNKSILILPTKYKINDIPAEWRTVDVLVADFLSSKFSKLKVKDIVLYGSQYKVDKTMNYAPKNNAEVYKLYFYGTINLTFKNENFSIGV